jgi:4-hydroxy-tetrahydrodipicolinate reductase
MTYRVIEWSTGKVGALAVAGIVAHPDLELAGLWVHSEEKEGRDAGELCGIDPVGVLATRDAGALIASDADCICYTPTSYSRVDEVVDDITKMLRAGKNVVSTAQAPWVYPRAAGDGALEQLEAACRDGGTSFYTWGIDPGYGAIGSAIGALSMCHEVRRVRMGEIINYSTWDSAYNLTLFGFGEPDASKALLLQPGVTTAMWGTSVAMVADALGLQLDEITEWHDVVLADDDFDITAGHIAKGTVAAMRFEIRGMVDGEPRVVVEHITRLRDGDAPLWDHGDGYRVLIEGEPNIRLDLALSSTNGDTVHAAYVATAMPVVNAIPQVCEAPPGVLTFLDLRPHVSRNVPALAEVVRP